MPNYIKIEDPKIFYKPIYIYKNPTFSQYINILENSTYHNIKGFIDYKNKDFYVVDAYMIYHSYLLHYLEYNEEDGILYSDNGFYIILRGQKLENLGFYYNSIISKLTLEREITWLNKSQYFSDLFESFYFTYIDYIKIKNLNDVNEFYQKYPKIKKFLTPEILLEEPKKKAFDFGQILSKKYNNYLSLKKSV